MRNIVRLLTATVATVFTVCVASAEIGAYTAAQSSAQETIVTIAERKGGSHSGKGFGSQLGRGIGHLGKGVGNLGKGLGNQLGKGLGGHFGKVFGQGHGGGHGLGNGSGKESASAGHMHHVGGKGTATHDLARPGELAEHHGMKHLALDGEHSALVGHTFKTPGGHLNRRLRKLRNRHWHSHYKHVVIVGAIGGAAACDLYCEFDVPDDVYEDFVAAVGGAQAPDVEADESKADEARFASLDPEDAAAKRVEQEHGWNKAVAILEEAAAQEDREIGEAKKDSKEVAAVIDRPDEQVDVVMDDAGTVEVVIDDADTKEDGKKK